ncbi:hypothetical protein [Phreatobacter stygius]|uniref:Uncharacterized protein n=1 Tax=Phreatobacter stygius TaxID=1940610 RepID=A0A4D7BAK5_9HYPH|nr:hypothetical protein [Phreatobacter stygius]QCI67660.1 hypothetical protein E8M01_27595 [Phreatobacter stygius]
MSAARIDEPWLSLERIAFSDLGAMLFAAVDAEGINDDRVAELIATALHVLGNGRCIYLASAVAGDLNFPVAAFRRQTIDHSLVHAAVMEPRTGKVVDILGAKSLAELREELKRAIGPVVLTVQAPLSEADFAPGEKEDLLKIAAGLPWMPRGCRPATAWSEWMMLVSDYAKRFG